MEKNGKIDKVYPYKVVVVGNEPLRTGMALAGIKEGYPIEQMNEVLKREDIGMIMVEDESILRRKYENSTKPMFVFLPKIGEKLKEEESLRRLIKRAIGVDLLKNGEESKEQEHERV